MKLYQDEVWLRKKYVNEGLSQEDIAEQAGCSNATIYRALHRYSIPTRTANGYVQGMTFVERFWSKVDKLGPEDCWEWKTPAHAQGYGQIYFRSKCEYSHRISYGMAHGIWPLPSNKQVNHFCDNPSCVNPKHLYLGTVADNAHDRSDLSWEDVNAIRDLDGSYSYKQIGELYEISASSACSICLYKSWKDGVR